MGARARDGRAVRGVVRVRGGRGAAAGALPQAAARRARAAAARAPAAARSAPRPAAVAPDAMARPQRSVPLPVSVV